MRALQFTEYGPPGVLHVAEVAEPHAGPGEIRIATRASGVSTGETLVRSGAYRDRIPATFPHRTGFDAAGRVDEIGPGVTGVRPGDEVFGMTTTTSRGANADHVVLVGWAAKPAGWSWAEAGGAAGSVETSYRVLDRLGVEAGRTVLINGAAGSVGSVAVQVAAARGARVIGTASPGNHEFLRSLGAEPVEYGPGLTDRVRALAPEGVDAAFDCATGALADLIDLTGDKAKVVTISDFTAPEYGVHFSHGVPDADSAVGADPAAAYALEAAAALAAEGRLTIPIAATFDLADAAAAHELSETRHARGRIVLLH